MLAGWLLQTIPTVRSSACHVIFFLFQLTLLGLFPVPSYLRSNELSLQCPQKNYMQLNFPSSKRWVSSTPKRTSGLYAPLPGTSMLLSSDCWEISGSKLSRSTTLFSSFYFFLLKFNWDLSCRPCTSEILDLQTQTAAHARDIQVMFWNLNN